MVLGGPIKGYTTNLVQGSYKLACSWWGMREDDSLHNHKIAASFKHPLVRDSGSRTGLQGKFRGVQYGFSKSRCPRGAGGTLWGTKLPTIFPLK